MLGLGLSFTFALAVDLVVASAPPERAGSAVSVGIRSETSQRVVLVPGSRFTVSLFAYAEPRASRRVREPSEHEPGSACVGWVADVPTGE